MNARYIQYATTCDGVAIAFVAQGEGPVLVQLVGLTGNNLELRLQDPAAERWRSTLAHHRRVVAFDFRGLGASESPRSDYSVATFCDDLQAVIERVSGSPVDLFAFSEASIVALAFAATRPELVRRIVLWHGRTRGRREDVFALRGPVIPPSSEDDFDRWARDQSGAGIWITGDVEVVKFSYELLRGLGYRRWRVVSEALELMDARPYLGRVRAPVLLMLRPLVAESIPLLREESLTLLRDLPDARLVHVPGDTGFPGRSVEEDLTELMTQLDAFLGAPPDSSIHANDRSSPGRSLSAREIEVLRLIIEGKSNAQIADVLFISASTVARHVSHILEKTGAANRSEAAVLAVRQGLTG